ncbi:hypothetical protein KC19_7G130200 [Ceratodon purpureus]|uniref:Calmodulin-binding domain-containing protein n=1 Tax=Ceratodon purpureus TaxID=3225 RepID=A0A8T0HEB0_CERPU|nr:hypothetical protein KC19_7G130200 [Ceratodon purpureus]
MEHTKVYPFTVSLPRYASWRKFAQALLKQLKACPACRGAADGFPVSILPKTHKLPNGKLLIFKALTSATDQGPLCTNNEVVEEYDMVSIDPNCPRHGKYSRTAWLRKQSTKSAGVNVRPRQQILSKARESKNQSRQNALNRRAHETDEVGRISSSNLRKTLEVDASPSSMAVSVLKERRGENFQPNWQTQIVVPTKTVAAKDLKYMRSILVQKQLNVLSVCDQKKALVLKNQSATRLAEKSIEQRVYEGRTLDSNYDQPSEGNVITEKREATTLMVRKELRAISVSDFEKNVHKCAETYASQFRRMCLLKELNCLLKKPFDAYHEAVETTEDPDRKLLEHLARMDIEPEFKMPSSVDVPSQHENGQIADETASSAGFGSSTSVPTRLPEEVDQLAIDEAFNLEELQQTSSLVERLNKIANTAKTLQLELEDHPVREGTPTARVLTHVQVVDRKDARDWLLDTAIEKAINNLPGEGDGRRVRHLVQAFESIK